MNAQRMPATLCLVMGLIAVVGWWPAPAVADPAAAADVAVREVVEPVALNSAVQRSVALLEESAFAYTEKRECFSCHHQTLPAVTLSMARRRGYDVDARRMASQADFTLNYFGQRRDQLHKGEGVPGGPFTAGYALVGLHAAGRKADDTTAALIAYLFKTQQKNGQWRIRTHRPPLEDSHFTATALAVRGIQLFAAKEQMGEVARRTADACRWLLESLDEPEPGPDKSLAEKPAEKSASREASQPSAKRQSLTGEDRTFRLLGLHWSGADGAAIQKAADDLVAQQRSDGGWPQTDDMASDAYATGQALVALHQTGLATDATAYRRGAEYLTKTRLTDGSWLVATRSKPIQTYFESGFPHGKSQFISICGTSWATQALLLAE